MNDIGTTYDVYLLGDVDTSKRLDILAEGHRARRGDHSTFAFPTGTAAQRRPHRRRGGCWALGTAIASRTPIWVPFWLQDLCRREQHLRQLEPDPAAPRTGSAARPGTVALPGAGQDQRGRRRPAHRGQGGLRLDDAAMAAAGMHALGSEIEAALAQQASGGIEENTSAPRRPRCASASLRRGCHGVAARCSRYTRTDRKWSPSGSAKGGRRRFTVPMLRAMAWSAYRRGTLTRSSSCKGCWRTVPQRAVTPGPSSRSDQPILSGENHDRTQQHFCALAARPAHPRLLGDPGPAARHGIPGRPKPGKALRKLRVLQDAGVSSFVDLTGPATDLGRHADASMAAGTRCRLPALRHPDTSVIDDKGLRQDPGPHSCRIAAGKVVLTHCWGGRGRTGTVVGAWLIDEGGLGCRK